MWFRKHKKLSAETQAKAAQKTAIEIVTHKNATQEVIAEANEANKHLRNLLEENHFTLKIYLATGGKQPKAVKGKG